jgi:WD40 repeat protein|tara:strand:- start:1366 stop:1659 length:294 start_codon:yes stop_codon:yes gene_type:complete
LIATLKGHKKEIPSLAFSPDSNTLASGSLDTTVKLWDVTTRKLKMTLKGHTHETYFIAFSSDGKTLASATRNETIKLWDVTMGKLRTTLHSSKVDSE